MKLNWTKWICMAVVAMGFAMPAGAVELKISGEYEMQGRYYAESDWVKAKYPGATTTLGSRFVADVIDATDATLDALLQYSTSSPAPVDYTAIAGPVIGAQLNAAADALGLDRTNGNTLVGGINTMKTQLAVAKLDSDILMEEAAAITDTKSNDAYLKHYFSMTPELIINDNARIVMDIDVFENVVSDADYGTVDAPGFTEEDVDSYTLMRIQNLYADVTTDFGKFILGKHSDFTGIGYFIQLPDMEEWTYGLIWHKEDEDEANGLLVDVANNYKGLNSDDYDEDGIVALAAYNSDNLSAAGSLSYAWSGKDNAETSYFNPAIDVAYSKDGLGLNFYLSYTDGTYVKKDSNKLRNVAFGYQDILAIMTANAPALTPVFASAQTYPYSITEDLEYKGAVATYVEASYDIAAGDATVTPVFTLAYASGAKAPNEIDGAFSDSTTFGSWLMNDVVDASDKFIISPVTADAVGNAGDDDYSFSNVILVRMGLNTQVSEDVLLEGNLLYAQKADTTYLEEWNPEWGFVNCLNPAMSKIAMVGQYTNTVTGLANVQKNEVSKDMGWEVNAKATWNIQDNFSAAVEASYFAPGGFYQDMIEGAVPFQNTLENMAFASVSPLAVKSGLEVEPTWAARWIATVSF